MQKAQKFTTTKGGVPTVRTSKSTTEYPATAENASANAAKKSAREVVSKLLL
jgi:hypothetical protein